MLDRKLVLLAEAPPACFHSPLEGRLGKLPLLREDGVQFCVDTFVDPWHRNEGGRTDRLEIFREQHDRAVDGHGAAHAEREVVAKGPFERMGNRQAREENVAHDRREAVGRVDDVREEVPMGEHDALRLPGRAGRVDDRSKVVRLRMPGEGGFRNGLARFQPVLQGMERNAA